MYYVVHLRAMICDVQESIDRSLILILTMSSAVCLILLMVVIFCRQRLSWRYFHQSYRPVDSQIHQDIDAVIVYCPADQQFAEQVNCIFIGGLAHLHYLNPLLFFSVEVPPWNLSFSSNQETYFAVYMTLIMMWKIELFQSDSAEYEIGCRLSDNPTIH